MVTTVLFYYKALTVQRYSGTFFGSQKPSALSANGWDMTLFCIGLRPGHIRKLQTWLTQLIPPNNEAKCSEKTPVVQSAVVNFHGKILFAGMLL